ncbi:MAG TPA: hypothetical protein VM889_00670 [Candidatus Thermoplasmatota archaeon]|nr:hypothetical protein [Candidatus Thermoplasmatota archaeon]
MEWEGRDLHPDMMGNLSLPARRTLENLLVYKAVFTGAGFRAFAECMADEDVGGRLARISRDSVMEGAAVAEALAAWDRLPGADRRLDELARETQTRLVSDLIRFKKAVTEAGLHVAMAAPTSELRDALVELVDLDRRHADDLRTVVGQKTISERASGMTRQSLGAHDGRRSRSSLGATIEETIETLRSEGAKPTRLVLAPDAVRHLRDEGAIGADARAFGLSVDVDLGWSGEAFAIVTEARIAYAEIVSAVRSEGPAAP